MFELIPFGNVNVLNVTGDQNCFECILDLRSVKECLSLITGLYKNPLYKAVGVLLLVDVWSAATVPHTNRIRFVTSNTAL